MYNSFFLRIRKENNILICAWLALELKSGKTFSPVVWWHKSSRISLEFSSFFSAFLRLFMCEKRRENELRIQLIEEYCCEAHAVKVIKAMKTLTMNE